MPLPLKTILIDDESLAISRLRRLLNKHSDTFRGGSNNNTSSGVEATSSGTDTNHSFALFNSIHFPGLRRYIHFIKCRGMFSDLHCPQSDRALVGRFSRGTPKIHPCFDVKLPCSHVNQSKIILTSLIGKSRQQWSSVPIPH